MEKKDHFVTSKLTNEEMALLDLDRGTLGKGTYLRHFWWHHRKDSMPTIDQKKAQTCPHSTTRERRTMIICCDCHAWRSIWDDQFTWNYGRG